MRKSKLHLIPVDLDDLTLFGDDFAPEVVRAGKTYQLDRYVRYGKLIRDAVTARLANPVSPPALNWDAIVATKLKEKPKDEDEKRARREKAYALAVLSRARIAVLAGPAGTGKTLVVGMLLQALPEGRNAVLLAPTGKARVRLQAAARHEAKTVAQFLLGQGRYDETSQLFPTVLRLRYASALLTKAPDASPIPVRQSVAGTGCRIIFVGDPQQLPPSARFGLSSI